ncbi:hypothetical protein AHAS_Ahas12G0192400 [Arachis hypogaea]
MRLHPQFFRLLSVTDIHMIIQIVGSAPGFSHGIIDPIEISSLLLFYFDLIAEKNLVSCHQALVFVSM